MGDGPAFFDGALDDSNDVDVVADRVSVSVHADVTQIFGCGVACDLQADTASSNPMGEVFEEEG